MVALMDETADELRLKRRAARDESGGGEVAVPAERRRAAVLVVGRWETPVRGGGGDC